MDTQKNLIHAGAELGTDIFFDICKQYPMLDENDSRSNSMLLSLIFNSSVALMLRGCPSEFLLEQLVIARNAAIEIDRKKSEGG